MSEEIRNPNNEINDAALEGVSGGVSESKLAQAQHICEQCAGYKAAPDVLCGGGVEQLAEYLCTIPPTSYPRYYNCPFLKHS